VSGYHTKPGGEAPSQKTPSGPPDFVSNGTLAETFVVLCNWHGKIVWKSSTRTRVEVGDPAWKYAAKKSVETLKSAFAKVVALREQSVLEIDNERNKHFRLWMWPLNDPEIAVCILVRRIPNELSQLSERERECLTLLAQGLSTKDIAKKLDIGLTTVHTHLRRSREKLKLPTAEALIAFAGHYFYMPAAPITEGVAANSKRSG